MACFPNSPTCSRDLSRSNPPDSYFPLTILARASCFLRRARVLMEP
jgi:hypothetical protein